MNETPGKLTELQCRELAELLCHSLAVFGATLLPQPGAGHIRHIPADEHFNKGGIAADIQMGSLVLCLFAPDWLVAEVGGAHRPELAEWFVQRVKEVHRARARHLQRVAQARRMVEIALQRSSPDMTLVSLKTTLQRVDADLTGPHLQLEATVSMLNDALQPYMERLVGWTPRELASSARHHGPVQRKRQRASARLKAHRAVIEIDELAERAIVSAGATVAECANALLANCDSQTGSDRR